MYYNKKIFAFLDIFAFSDAINKTFDDSSGKENGTEIANIFNLLEDISESLKLNKFYNKETNNYRVASHISDSIFISYTITEKVGIISILFDILFLCFSILQKGFLTRGAIVKGYLHHSKGKIFGPAVNKAVKLEKELARYPRIIIDEEFFINLDNIFDEYISNQQQLKIIDKIVEKDFDGIRFLNYFSAMNHIIGFDNGILVYFKLLREIIENLIGNEKNNIENKSKNLWLKEKYNCNLKKYINKFKNDKEKFKHPEAYKYINSITYL